MVDTITWGLAIPTAAITINQHGGRRSRFGKLFAVHANIMHTFRGLGFHYSEWHVCIYLASLFDSHVATFTTKWWGRKRWADGNLQFGMMVITDSTLPSAWWFLPHRLATKALLWNVTWQSIVWMVRSKTAEYHHDSVNRPAILKYSYHSISG